ncbi:hypothetical protein AB3662_01380 [Sorangium cellulosum]|uniref:hypothetical protein n=1 Tax=Sorangium cellulosum TaxID=56 RepID=UPI003D9A92B6
MKPMILALGVIAIASTGCDEIVFEPAFDGTFPSNPVTPPSPSEPEEEDDPPTPSALAMRAGDAPPGSDYRTLEDPDTLLLFFNSDVQECPPTAIKATCENAPRWQLILTIPSDLAVPGLIDLSDRRIFFTESLSEATPSCALGGGAGTGYRGTLEIVTSDETSLFVKLRGAGMRGQAEGDFTAQRCGAALETAPGG